MTSLLDGTGSAMHNLAQRLFPECRSLSGNGTRNSLRMLQEVMPDLQLHEVASGTRALDWIVPDEWNIREAWISDLSGNRLIDFGNSNLHVVGYSMPVDAIISRDDLDPHLFSLPNQPEAIPYVTSYYSPTWGFCVSEYQRRSLGEGPFRVFIDSDLRPGAITYGELVLPGRTRDEVLLSTYICHPSMANNELSGPVVVAAISQWLKKQKEREYTYRIVLAPETIGSLIYLEQNLEHLRETTVAGWVITCVGDERTYSYLPSRRGGTVADRISLQVLGEIDPRFKRYSFLDRGSDERQWCSPGADLPVCSVMRSKYGTYPEYHTSLDDLTLVTPQGLQGSFEALTRCIHLLENNHTWTATIVGEPQMGRRGLYPDISFGALQDSTRLLMDVLAYCDGSNDLLNLCAKTGAPSAMVLDALSILSSEKLIHRVGITD